MRKFERWVEIAAATALVCLMIIVLVDVIGRDVLNRPLAAGTELTEVAMAFMAFVAFPLLAFRQRDITVDLFETIGSGAVIRKLQILLAGLIGCLVYGLVSVQMVTFAKRASVSGEATPQMGLPLAAIWWFMCVLAALASIASLVVALAALTKHPIDPAKHDEIVQ